MRINHNISAMNAHRLLNRNNSIGSKTLEKLSSGKRINRAGDDAAGMAISEKMRAQVRGLQIASRNSLDGVSLVQTAEGAMAEVHSMLQRMRELSVQAANGTSAESDRQAIQDEINQLTSEVNRVANGTEYNTRNVLKGNEGPESNALVHRMSTGESAQVTGNVDVEALAAGDFNLASEQLSVWVDGEEKVVNLTQTNNATTLNNFMDLMNDALGDSAKAIIDKNGFIEITTASMGGLSKIEIKGSGDAVKMIDSTFDPAAPVYPTDTGVAENATNTSKGTFYFDAVPEVGSTIKIGNETIEFFDSSVAPYVGSNRPIDIAGKATPEAVVDEIVNKFATGIDGVTLSKDAKFDSGAGTSDNARLIVTADSPGFDGNLIYLEATPKEFTTSLQVGANTGQGFRLEIGDIRAQKLKISADNPTRNPGVKGASYVKTGATVTDGISASMVEYAVDVTSEEKASAAISVFDNAIVQIAGERSRLGATQNRLEHTIANLDNTAENLTAAMSRVEDTDMALEMANFQKINVLQQAGVSMLAQANQQPQSILKLLG